MADVCHVDPLECLNNGKCVVNISSNMTYCQCDSCYMGTLCEAPVWEDSSTGYEFLIIRTIGLCLSILNNALVLELFIRSRRIRRTNSGIYLMIYSILSLLSSILLPVHEFVTRYRSELGISYDQYIVFRCYVHKVGYNTLDIFCLVLSACIASEQGLIICFGTRMKDSRWRLGTTLTVLFGISTGTVIPFLVYKCNWNDIPNLQTARNFFTWFYIIVSIAIYILATLLVLISFARRIHRYSMEDGSCMKTFLKLLYTHLFILVPPIAYGLCQLPYIISYETKNANYPYYRCGIPTVEYLMKVFAEALTGPPIVLTWLLFVYPSRVYMTEFYLHTQSGQRLARILLLFKLPNNREESNRSSTATLNNNEHYHKELTV